MKKIVKNNAVPLHEQLRSDIRSMIEHGEYKAEEHIPSTAELCDLYKVSMITVRRAVSDLIYEGILKGVPGKGTFVASQEPEAIGKTNQLIGIIFNNPASRPFYMEIFEGIEYALSAQGFSPITSTSHDSLEKERQLLAELMDKGAEGIIIIPVPGNGPPVSDSILKKITDTRFPLVFIDNKMPEIETDYVTCDNEKGGCVATSHMLNLGHTRVAFILGRDVNTVRERMAGYKRALTEFGLAFDPLMIKRSYPGLQYDESGYQNTLELLHLVSPPSAIFACSDAIALGVYRACHELGVNIPRDLSVIGYDDLVFSRSLVPPLTTIYQPKFEMGKEAGELLLRRIGGEKGEARQIILNVELIERASCCSPEKETTMASKMPRPGRGTVGLDAEPTGSMRFA